MRARSSRGADETRQRLLFYVVDWLPPDFGAVGQYAQIFARERVCVGRDVRLIGLTTGSRRTVSETVSGGHRLETTFLHSPAYQKSHYSQRMAWTVRTNLRLVWQVVRDPRSRRAEVIFTGAPPFMLFFMLLAKLVRRVQLTYRITDFYPEVLIAELGRLPALRALERLTWMLRRRVDRFEVLGEDQRALLLAGGIAPERVTLKRDVSPVRFRGDERPLDPPASLRGRQILLYSGNFSIAHDIETLVDGLIRHHRAGDAAFGLWLNATGARAAEAEQQLAAAGVPVARTRLGPLADLPRLLVSADMHLISLRPEFSGIVLPSKVYGCIASRRPVLFVGPANSDVHLLCAAEDLPAYERVEPGDIAGFAAALDRLSRSRSPRELHGAHRTAGRAG